MRPIRSDYPVDSGDKIPTRNASEVLTQKTSRTSLHHRDHRIHIPREEHMQLDAIEDIKLVYLVKVLHQLTKVGCFANKNILVMF